MDVDDRLFVPLKTKYFNQFNDGVKKYELRGVNDQFNTDTVYTGRVTELRKGYSSNQSLWAIIKDVFLFDSQNELFTTLESQKANLNHTMIIPGIDQQEFENEVKNLIGKYDRFICFYPDIEAIPQEKEAIKMCEDLIERYNPDTVSEAKKHARKSGFLKLERLLSSMTEENYNDLVKNIN